MYVFGLRVYASTFFLSVFSFFFLFFFPSRNCWPSASVHYSWTHKLHFSITFFSLKMGLTALFTHLKIILLQCFQFQFSVSAKISSIQTNPKFQSFLTVLLEILYINQNRKKLGETKVSLIFPTVSWQPNSELCTKRLTFFFSFERPRRHWRNSKLCDD